MLHKISSITVETKETQDKYLASDIPIQIMGLIEHPNADIVLQVLKKIIELSEDYDVDTGRFAQCLEQAGLIEAVSRNICKQDTDTEVLQRLFEFVLCIADKSSKLSLKLMLNDNLLDVLLMYAT